MGKERSRKAKHTLLSYEGSSSSWGGGSVIYSIEGNSTQFRITKDEWDVILIENRLFNEGVSEELLEEYRLALREVFLDEMVDA